MVLALFYIFVPTVARWNAVQGLNWQNPCCTNLANPWAGICVLFGGSPGVAQKAADIWQEQVPGLSIVGTQNGFLSPDEEHSFHRTLKELQPQLILVGLGVPRQEIWIAEHRALCPQAIWIGVGGSFDIWAGVKLRAPSGSEIITWNGSTASTKNLGAGDGCSLYQNLPGAPWFIA